MEFDKEELVRQYIDDIHDSNQYTEICVTLKCIDNEDDLINNAPMISITQKNSTTLTTALVLLSMEKTIKDMLKDDPELAFAFSFCKENTKNIGKIEVDRKDVENE